MRESMMGGPTPCAEAWREGYEAYGMGYARSDNPFFIKSDGDLRRAWDRGYMGAEECAQVRAARGYQDAVTGANPKATTKLVAGLRRSQ